MTTGQGITGVSGINPSTRSPHAGRSRTTRSKRPSSSWPPPLGSSNTHCLPRRPGLPLRGVPRRLSPRTTQPKVAIFQIPGPRRGTPLPDSRPSPRNASSKADDLKSREPVQLLGATHQERIEHIRLVRRKAARQFSEVLVNLLHMFQPHPGGPEVLLRRHP